MEGKQTVKTNKSATATKVCEDCGKTTNHFRGLRQGHCWCMVCYWKHRGEEYQKENVVSDASEKETSGDVNVKPTKSQIVFKPKSASVDMKQFIPKHNGYIARRINNLTDVSILDKAYKNKDFVLISGDTGTGKTHFVRHFCFKKKIPYVRINLNGGTTADELIGHWIPSEDGKFKWQDGLLTLFVRNGGIIVIDEVNSCSADILFFLHGLLDDERTLTLLDKDGEIINAHKDFMLVATMNQDYEGTKPLNWAFKSRFKVKLQFNYDGKIEKKLVPDEKILELATKLRVMRNKGEISTPISTRDLIYYVENCKTYGKKVAEGIYLNCFETFEREPIKNVLELLSKGKDLKEELAEEEDEEEDGN